MVMKIYGFGTSNVQRAILPLFEAEVDVEKEVKLVKVNLMAGEHKQPAYLAKQPFGVVPYLEDGDLSLFESRAIARYFAEKYASQGVPLLGKTPKEKANINQWAEVESQNFAPAAAPMTRELYVASLGIRPVNEELVASCVPKLEKVLDIYEARLSENKYLAGDNYSLADVFHTPEIYPLLTERVDLLKDRKHVYAWAKDITSRPAFLKAFETNSKWE